MRILDVDSRPLFEMPYDRARSGRTDRAGLDCRSGWVDTLADGLDVIIITADLQGYAECAGCERRLLGEVIAGTLARSCGHLGLGDRRAVDVLFAGHFWS